MAWIECHQSLLTHRKLIRLARDLDLPRVHAAGHLIALWCWALDNAPTGALGDLEPAELAEVMQWPGDPDTLWTALFRAGFLDETENGPALHDWTDYAGRLIDQRQAAAERMRRVRERSRNVPERSPNMRARSQQPNRTQPDRTGPNRTADEGRRRAIARAPLQVVACDRAVPKPNRAAEVVNLIRAAGVDVEPTRRDAAAIRESGASPQEIAAAYVAQARGEWGDDWDRDHLSVHRVVENLAGYRASTASRKRKPPGFGATPEEIRAYYLSGSFAHLIEH